MPALKADEINIRRFGLFKIVKLTEIETRTPKNIKNKPKEVKSEEKEAKNKENES